MKQFKQNAIYILPLGLLIAGLATVSSRPDQQYLEQANRLSHSTNLNPKLADKKNGKNKKQGPLVKRQPANTVIAQTKSNVKEIKKPLAPQFDNIYSDFQCYQKDDCDFPSEDPKAYHFAIGQKLKKTLMNIESSISENGVKEEKYQKLGQFFMAVPDGHVKEAALHILSSQEPSKDSFQAIIDGILNFHDPALIRHAMFELERYLGSSHEQKMIQEIAKVLLRGSPSVSKEISRYLVAFINSNSRDVFKEVLFQLHPRSIVYQRIQETLSEYEKRENAA